MALVVNQYGGINLQSTVVALDKRVTVLEAAPADTALIARVAAIEAELAALKAALK